MSRPSRLRTLAACLAAPALPPLAAAWMIGTTRRQRHRSTSTLSPRDVAIVPGCPPWPDGRPTPMLADRLAAGLELHRRGLVERILVSGNARSRRGDEVAAMLRWLLDRDVPRRDLVVDGEARRTRETMLRAAGQLGIRSAIICTQAFHLPRSVFLARRAGIDALGLVADRRRYRSPYFTGLRELAAQTLALVEELITTGAARG